MGEGVLIVDDEPNMRWGLTEALGQMGYAARVAASGEEALAEMARGPADLVLLDLKLKGMDGLATLRRLRERWPDAVVIILTAHGTVATAVEAMQLGAADYLRKPVDVEEIGFTIGRALERRALQAEVHRLREAGVQPAAPPAGTHPAWLQCLAQVQSLTALDLDIVFVGECGTGRRTLARYAHACSDRRAAPLVELDLHAIPAEAQRRLLSFEPATEGVWSRVGGGSLLLSGSECLTADGWQALDDLVSKRAARRPRLLFTAEAAPALAAGGRIAVPPLRDRLSDIVVLARALAPAHAITAAVAERLEDYDWPGNVGELQGVVQRAAVLAGDGPIDERHLPPEIRRSVVDDPPVQLPADGLNMEQVEIGLLRQALQRAHGNKTRAAELLGLTRPTLLYRLDKYGLDQTPES